MKLLLLCLAMSIAQAQDMSFLNPAAFEKTSVSAESSSIGASSDGPAVEEQKASAMVPVGSSTAILLKGQRTSLSERIDFSSTTKKIPREFGSADIGGMWSREDIGGDRIVVQGTYGSAGTQLINGAGTPVLGANLFFEKNKVTHSWFYFLNYSNNRTILNNIPIPGIAYAVRAKTYLYVIGAPFLYGSFRPDPWSFSAFVSPFGASAEGGYRFWGPLQIFSGAAWTPRAYQIDAGSEDRLIFDEKNYSAGLRASFGPVASFSVAYIHGFARSFVYGESLSDDDRETREIADGSGIQVKARASF